MLGYQYDLAGINQLRGEHMFVGDDSRKPCNLICMCVFCCISEGTGVEMSRYADLGALYMC